MISRRLNPWLVSVFEAVESELACALETRHRNRDICGGENESVTCRILSQRIARLRRLIGALQAALGRDDSTVVH
jgi:hypothetical protein